MYEFSLFRFICISRQLLLNNPAYRLILTSKIITYIFTGFLMVQLKAVAHSVQRNALRVSIPYGTIKR